MELAESRNTYVTVLTDPTEWSILDHMNTNSNSAIKTEAVSVDDMIIAALNHPEQISDFGSAYLPSIDVPSVDPNTTERFISGFVEYIENLMYSHPWVETVFSEKQAKTPIRSKVTFPFLKVSTNKYMDTGLLGHYRYIRALAYLQDYRDALDEAVAEIREIYTVIDTNYNDADHQLSQLKSFVEDAYAAIDSNPAIRSLRDSKPDVFARLSSRLAALSARTLVDANQRMQIEMVKETVLRNIDRYHYLTDVFLPAYEQQKKMLESAPMYEQYKYFMMFNEELRQQKKAAKPTYK